MQGMLKHIPYINNCMKHQKFVNLNLQQMLKILTEANGFTY